MNNSIAWFRNHYDGAAVKIIMIHPVRKLGSGAGFNEPTEITGYRELERLKRNTRSFFNEFKGLDLTDLSQTKIQSFLEMHKLTVEDFLANYSAMPES